MAWRLIGDPRDAVSQKTTDLLAIRFNIPITHSICSSFSSSQHLLLLLLHQLLVTRAEYWTAHRDPRSTRIVGEYLFLSANGDEVVVEHGKDKEQGTSECNVHQSLYISARHSISHLGSDTNKYNMRNSPAVQWEDKERGTNDDRAIWGHTNNWINSESIVMALLCRCQPINIQQAGDEGTQRWDRLKGGQQQRPGRDLMYKLSAATVLFDYLGDDDHKTQS